VNVVNVGLKNEIQWPSTEDVPEVVVGFYHLCGLPSVVGVIDRTHFAISKPQFATSDYFYFKSGGYSMTC